MTRRSRSAFQVGVVVLALGLALTLNLVGCSEGEQRKGKNIQPVTGSQKKQGAIKNAQTPEDHFLIDTIAALNFGHSVFSQACGIALHPQNAEAGQAKIICESSSFADAAEILMDHQDLDNNRFVLSVSGQERNSSLRFRRTKEDSLQTVVLRVGDRQTCVGDECFADLLTVTRVNQLSYRLTFGAVLKKAPSPAWTRLAQKPLDCEFDVDRQRVIRMSCEGDIGRDYGSNRALIFSEIFYQKNGEPLFMAKVLHFEAGKAVCPAGDCRPEKIVAPKDERYVVFYRNLEHRTANQAEAMTTPKAPALQDRIKDSGSRIRTLPPGPAPQEGSGLLPSAEETPGDVIESEATSAN